MTKKIISLLLAMLMLAALFAGCGSSNNEKSETSPVSVESTSGSTTEAAKDPNAEPFTITLSSWQYNDDPAIDVTGKTKAYKEATTNLFNTKYPNATIQWDNIPGEKYFDILKAKLASNSAADVMVHQSMLGEIGKGGFAVNLSDQPWVSNMLDICKTSVSYEGKIIAAPGEISGWGAWYNKKIFREYDLEAPETYTDFLDICETLKSNGITPFACGFKDSWTASGFWNMMCPAFLYKKDKEFLINVTKGTRKLTDPEVEDVFNRIQEIMDKGYVNKNCLSIGWDQSRAEFIKGNGAMMIQGAWLPSVVEGEDKDFEMGWMTIPNDAGDVFVTAGVGAVVSVNASSKLIEQGKDLIAAFRDESTFGVYITNQAASSMKGWDLKHSNPAFKEWSDSFNKYPTAYAGDAFYASSAVTDLTNIVIKMASGKKFDKDELKADLQKAQFNAEKDKGTVVLPE